jgi:hypothetical protein
MNEPTGVKFRTAAHKAELDTGDGDKLIVQRGANGRRYRAEAFGSHRAFIETLERGAERDRMKRIINGSEADAWMLLSDLIKLGQPCS